MKNKINAVLSLGACALCLSLFSLFSTAFADAAQPTVKIGVVAQRYPWNGMVDVKVKVSGVTAEAGATLTVTATPPASSVGGVPPSTPRAEPVEVIKLTGVKDGERTVSFNANDFDALKGKKLNDVKIAAKVE